MFEILSDEKLKALRDEGDSLCRQLANDTEGRWKQEDMVAIWDANDRAALEAQKNHTLKQVIEWGNEPCDSNHFFHEHRRDCPLCWAGLLKEVESGR